MIARSQFTSILVIPERKGTTLEELKVVMVTLYNNYVLINSFVLQSLFRSSHIVEKNYTTFLECELVSNGFTETKELTKALNGCLNDLQVSSLLTHSHVLQSCTHTDTYTHTQTLQSCTHTHMHTHSQL